MSQDNVLADSLAKAYLNHLIRHDYTPTTQRFGDEGWSVKIDGVKLARVNVLGLYKAVYEPTAEKYWMTKTHLPRELIRSIDWDICGEAYRQIRFHQQRRISKQATGHLAVGLMMQRWGFQENDECPRCQAPAERAMHVLLCHDPRADLAWSTALTNLERWMILTHTMPQLRIAILAGLSHWRNPLLERRTSSVNAIQQAVELQDKIGWYQFVMGQMGYLWKGIQQEYLEFLGRRNTGRKWVRELIKKFWGIAWDMWEHRNGILHDTITPAKLQKIAQADIRVREEFAIGIIGLLPRDLHWVSQPIAVVLRYDLQVKAQWLESVALARERYTARHELNHATMRMQRDLMDQWLTQGAQA